MTLRGLFHLLVVYIVWGSTYLAIRIAVREGSGFPPFIMVTLRTILASGILFAWARLAGSTLKLSKAELRRLALVAVLLWVGGNGFVTVAEKWADSGYAALLVGTMPLWVAIMESIIDRKRPSVRLIGALVVGLAGVAILNGPVMVEGDRQDLIAAVLLILAPISWGIGSIIQRRRPVSVSPNVSSAYQQLLGGGGLFLAALLTREPVPHPVPEAWMAWAYLTIFGSVFAFTSFVKALQLLPTNIVMTYAYVNPVIAVILGWMILDEPITLWTFAGTVLVVLGVLGVFNEKRRDTSPAARTGRAAERPAGR